MEKREYRILYQGGTGELVEKKSRFIASVAGIGQEQDALDFIAAKKKEYWDARHNCYAFTLGDNHQLTRASDDGEPAGTAGRPILDVLLREEIHNAVIVVTRYFGGVLLGTGGLVRAYQGAAQAGLAASCIAVQKCGQLLTIHTDYTEFGRIRYVLEQEEIPILGTEYGQDVTISLCVETDRASTVSDLLTDKCGGRIRIEAGSEQRFIEMDHKILLSD